MGDPFWAMRPETPGVDACEAQGGLAVQRHWHGALPGVGNARGLPRSPLRSSQAIRPLR